MKKNILAVLLGVFITHLLLAAMEIIFRYNESHGYVLFKKRPESFAIQNFDIEKSKKLNAEFSKYEIFNWKPLLSAEDIQSLRGVPADKISTGAQVPCCVGRVEPVLDKSFYVSLVEQRSKKSIYKAHYTFDSKGRRITPDSKSDDYNILMFGDSFLLGEGVHDEQSGPWVLGTLRPQAKVYNFGVAGGSANEFLYELQMSPSLRLEGIPSRRSIVLYSYMDNHLERLFCRSFCLRPEHNWILTKPFYDVGASGIELEGFFDQDRKFINRIYWLLNQSALLRYFDFIWPLNFSERHFDFFAQLIQQAKIEAQSRFKDVDFYLVLYPGASGIYGPALRQACEKLNIQVLDYSDLDMRVVTGGKANIPMDGHPSPVSQYIFGNLLNRDLAK